MDRECRSIFKGQMFSGSILATLNSIETCNHEKITKIRFEFESCFYSSSFEALDDSMKRIELTNCDG